jgi:hypothetical protein
MALFALPLAMSLIGWQLSTARWRVDSPGLLGVGQGFLLGAFVGVTKPAEQAASPVLLGCTSAGAFQDLHLVHKGRREAAHKGLASKRQKLAEYVATVTIEVLGCLTSERWWRCRSACGRTGDRRGGARPDPPYSPRPCGERVWG